QGTLGWIGGIVRDCGHSGRTFKSALLFAVCDSATPLQEAARRVLAWEAIRDEQDDLGLDETQKRQLSGKLQGAERDLRDAVWSSYRHMVLLDKDNSLRDIDLGLVHSSASTSMTA